MIRALIACTALAASGCSFAFVDRPAGSAEPACTRSYGLPIVDTVPTVALAALGIYLMEAFAKDKPSTDAPSSTMRKLGLASTLLALPFGASAGYGYYEVHRCRD
jgi:hypothetical protein